MPQDPIFIVVVFVAVSLRQDVRWLGLFVIGPVLLTLGIAITVWYIAASELLPSLKSFWLVIHVTVATFAVALFTIAFSVTILHLVKTWLEAQGPRDVPHQDGHERGPPTGAVTGPDGIWVPRRGVPAVDLRAYCRRYLG